MNKDKDSYNDYDNFDYHDYYGVFLRAPRAPNGELNSILYYDYSSSL